MFLSDHLLIHFFIDADTGKNMNYRNFFKQQKYAGTLYVKTYEHMLAIVWGIFCLFYILSLHIPLSHTNLPTRSGTSVTRQGNFKIVFAFHDREWNRSVTRSEQ